MTKKTKKVTINETEEKDFNTKVAELKKSKTKEELLEIVSVQPLNSELRDFTAARRALDELGVKYSKSFAPPEEENKE